MWKEKTMQVIDILAKSIPTGAARKSS